MAKRAALHKDEGSEWVFGELLAAHIRRKELTQEQFAKAMRDSGYQERMGRNMVCYITKHETRVYPEFFGTAQRVLRLTDEETDALALAYARRDPEVNRTYRVDLKVTLA